MASATNMTTSPALHKLTGLGTVTNIPWSNPAIHLNMLIHSVKPLSQLPRLFQTLGHELLSTRTRVNGHDQDHIRRVESFVGDGARRGLRGDGESGQHAVFLDGLDDGKGFG